MQNRVILLPADLTEQAAVLTAECAKRWQLAAVAVRPDGVSVAYLQRPEAAIWEPQRD